MLTIRSTLVQRIEALMRTVSDMHVVALSEELDEIRSFASIHRLHPVERLASLLGSVIAYNGHKQVAYNYLDLMRDAARCADDGPDVASAYLAAASLRGCRPAMRK
jgi:hypothetical protein